MLIARSAVLRSSELGFRDTPIVLYPFCEKFLMMLSPTRGPAPRTRTVFVDMALGFDVLSLEMEMQMEWNRLETRKRRKGWR